MAKKKEFRENPVLAYISQIENAQDDTQTDVHSNAHDLSSAEEHNAGLSGSPQKDSAHTDVHTDTHADTHKKHFNHAIESRLYERVKMQAEREGKSVAQYFNDLALNDIARSDYTGKRGEKR